MNLKPRERMTLEEYEQHKKPTRDNQIWHARRILYDCGADELKRHAMVGDMCGCGTCFCCAAKWVYQRRHNEGM